MKTYQTYIHIRNDTGQVFYVGAGTDRRPHATSDRSKAWKQLAANGYSIEIVSSWDTPQDAGVHEKFLIECFRDLGHPLTNKRSGGEGLGYEHTEEIKSKLSHLARNRSPETRALISAAHTGKRLSEETRKKLSIKRRARVITEETKLKLSIAGKRRTQSDETKAKMSLSIRGENSVWYGKKLSPEHRAKMSESQRLRQERTRKLKKETP